MEALKINLEIVGDVISAISEAHRISQCLNKTLFLEDKFLMSIRPTSDVHDLIDIYELKKKLVDNGIQV